MTSKTLAFTAEKTH